MIGNLDGSLRSEWQIRNSRHLGELRSAANAANSQSNARSDLLTLTDRVERILQSYTFHP